MKEWLAGWPVLVLAGLCEIIWAVGLKYTDGFKKLWPSVGTIAAMLVSFWLLSTALKSLPLGTAYAVWTGIGVIGTAVLGIILFQESAALGRLVCIALIMCGIVGLKIMSK